MRKLLGKLSLTIWNLLFGMAILLNLVKNLDFSGKQSATLQLLREDFVQISISACNQVLIYTAECELWHEITKEITKSFETAARGFEPGFYRLRVQRSNRSATARARQNTVVAPPIPAKTKGPFNAQCLV